MRSSRYLDYLPGVFALTDELNGRVLEKMLLAFEDILSSGYVRDRRGQARAPESGRGEVVMGVEQMLDNLSRFFRPDVCPHRPEEPAQSFLVWLQRTVGLDWPEHLSEREQRDLLAIAVRELYPKRGTLAGITLYLERVAQVTDVRIEQNRWPANMQIGGRSTLGVDTLLSDEGRIERDHCFLVHVHVPWHRVWRRGAARKDRGLRAVASRVHRVLSREKPAHTRFRVRLSVSAMQIGCSSTIGEDTVLIEAPEHVSV